MIRHLFKLLIILAIGAALFYVSRFWNFSLWGREGLFGIAELRPQGDLLDRWIGQLDRELRGFPALRPFELLIWVVGGFLILTWVQKIFDFLTPTEPRDEESKDE